MQIDFAALKQPHNATHIAAHDGLASAGAAESQDFAPSFDAALAEQTSTHLADGEGSSSQDFEHSIASTTDSSQPRSEPAERRDEDRHSDAAQHSASHAQKLRSENIEESRDAAEKANVDSDHPWESVARGSGFEHDAKVADDKVALDEESIEDRERAENKSEPRQPPLTVARDPSVGPAASRVESLTLEVNEVPRSHDAATKESRAVDRGQADIRLDAAADEAPNRQNVKASTNSLPQSELGAQNAEARVPNHESQNAEPKVQTRPGQTPQQAREFERASAQREPEKPVQRPLGETRPERIAAAAGRAAQVEAAIRLEHATGNGPNTDAASRLTNQGPQLTVAPLAGQTQPGTPSIGQFINAAGESQGDSSTSAARTALDEGRFASRVIRGLTAMINSRGGTMTMRLDPPEMGQLRIQMTLARGIVTAEFHAQNPQAQHMLEKSMSSLRAALESQGLTVERLNVNSQNSSQQNSMMHEDGSARDQHAARHDAGNGQSRGRRDADAPNNTAAETADAVGFDDLIEQNSESAVLGNEL